MPNKHAVKLLGWHPSSAEDAEWVRTYARKRGVALKVVLDEMLARYRRAAEETPEAAGAYAGK